MMIGSTNFPHKNIHVTTWRSQDGKTTNLIYHILINARHKYIMVDIEATEEQIEIQTIIWL